MDTFKLPMQIMSYLSSSNRFYLKLVHENGTEYILSEISFFTTIVVFIFKKFIIYNIYIYIYILLFINLVCF